MTSIVNIYIKEVKKDKLQSKLIDDLEFEARKLLLMEQQYLHGEDIELPIKTLGEWISALCEQRALVERIQKMLADQSFIDPEES